MQPLQTFWPSGQPRWTTPSDSSKVELNPCVPYQLHSLLFSAPCIVFCNLCLGSAALMLFFWSIIRRSKRIRGHLCIPMELFQIITFSYQCMFHRLVSLQAPQNVWPPCQSRWTMPSDSSKVKLDPCAISATCIVPQCAVHDLLKIVLGVSSSCLKKRDLQVVLSKVNPTFEAHKRALFNPVELFQTITSSSPCRFQR